MRKTNAFAGLMAVLALGALPVMAVAGTAAVTTAQADEAAGTPLVLQSTDDGTEISIEDVSWEVPSSFAWTDEAVSIPAPVYNGVALTLGTDYNITYWKSSDFEDWYEYGDECEPLAGAPSEVGYYVAYITGMGTYTDSKYKEFSICDYYDLEYYYEIWFMANGEEVDDFCVGQMPDGFTVVLLNGYEVEYEPVVGTDYTLTWERYTDAGMWESISDFTGDTVGRYRVTATGTESSLYHGSVQGYIGVLDPYALENAYLEIKDIWGTPASPEPIVRMEGSDAVLVKGQDYTLAFYEADKDYDEDGEWDGDSWQCSDRPVSLPIETEGIYFVVATGVNPYSGSTNAYELSIRNSKDLRNATVDFDQYSYPYTGNPVEPVITVTDILGNLLTEGTHYTVGYGQEVYNEEEGNYELVPLESAPTEQGKNYYVEVTAIDESGYIGSNTEGFNIVASNDLAGAKVTISGREILYTGDPVDLGLTVTLLGKTLVKGVDYDVAYREDIDTDSDNDHLFPWSETAPSALGEYVMRITAHEGSNYTGTAARYFMIVNEPSAQSLKTAKVTAADQTYTGEALTPAVTVVLGTETLVAGTDYDVSYSNNTNAGTANVTVTGKGKYSDKAYGTFTIAKAEVAVPAAKTGLVYTGKKLVGVEAGDGYVAENNAATNAGSYTATVTPDANHVWADGSTEAKAVKWSIAKASQTVKTKNKTATLKAKTLKKKAQTIKASVVKKGNSAKTSITYSLVKASKAKKYFKVAKSGKITVKKGLKKGTYKLTLKATAKASANYKQASKNFIVTVKVK